MPFIRCPACNARYKVSAEAGGKSAKCLKCGQAFRIPALTRREPLAADEQRLTDLNALGAGEAIELAGLPPPPSAPTATGPLVEAVPVADALTYAPGMTGEAAAVARGAYGAYFRSLAQSLAFPVRVGDLITFAIIWVILIAGEYAAYGGACLGLLVSFIITGWYMSFQLNVVLGAANGEEDLPTLALTEGWWDDMVAPFFKMLATYIVIHLPAVIFLVIAAGWQVLSGSAVVRAPWTLAQVVDAKTAAVAGGLLLVGYFLWPILVLIVAVGNVIGFVRVDLIARTIARSLAGYLLTVLAVYVSIGLNFGAAMLLRVATTRPGGTLGGWPPVLALAPPVQLVELYFTVVAMRAIGFYYHHFKHRFAWSWG
jgi:predicted Zn finger-like uncharacterized protein